MTKIIILSLSLIWVTSASAQFKILGSIKPEVMSIPINILSGDPVDVNRLYSCKESNELTLPIDPRESGQKFAEKCTNFIDKSGSFGPYGKEIHNYILEQGNTSRFFNKNMPGMMKDPGTCPNWENLNNSQKILFWVWTMTSIAHVESSCDNRKVNWGRVPNSSDRPRGLFQLNTLKANRKWRGANCGFSSKHEDVFNPKNNIRCSMDIMDEILMGQDGEYKSNGKIYPTNSYWYQLRKKEPAGGKIAKLMKTFPLCN